MCRDTYAQSINQSISVKGVLREINSGSKYENLVDVREISGSTDNALGSTTEIRTQDKPAVCCWVTTGGRDPPRGQTVNGGVFLVSMTHLVTGLGVPGTEWDRGRQALLLA